MFASVFILLYVGHLLADYPLQTDHQAGHKADRGVEGWRANLAHAGTHVLACGVLLCSGVLLLDVDVSAPGAVGALVWIGVTHAFIDRRWPVRWWMEHTRQPEFAQHGGAAHVDQTAHVLAVVVAAFALAV